MKDDVISSGVVENLVTQFSSALDCFRELVQNSIDAGSSRVEVWSEYQAGDGHMGTIIFHVDDYGEGMDEAIIDEQLTRLFASAKENDLTKIGKFGIGFISVFALEPRAVLVNTGRGGEYWEILFHEDRSFSKTTLDVPVEGTQVTIFMEGDYHRYREQTDGVRETLNKWCAHSETEVTYEDRSPPGGDFSDIEEINAPFEVEGDCPTHIEVPGTEIVMSYTDKPVYGFYNRGLTLAWSEVGEQVFSIERASRFKSISVKIKSRYLEHTLSRETVMRDENYEKAMSLLDDGANVDLLGKLTDELETLVGLPTWTLKEMSRYSTLCHYLRSEPEESLGRISKKPILRGANGEPLTLEMAREAFRGDGRILLAEHPSDLTRQLAELEVPVFLGRAPTSLGAHSGVDGSIHPLDAANRLIWLYVAQREERTWKAQAMGIICEILDLKSTDIGSEVWQSMNVPEEVYLNVSLDEETPDELHLLVKGAHRALRKIGSGFRRVRTFTPLTASADPPLFVTARKLGGLMARPPRGVKETKKRLDAAVNRRHPYVKALVRFHRRSPALAAYCLAKGLLLYQDRMLDRDVALMKVALASEGR